MRRSNFAIALWLAAALAAGCNSSSSKPAPTPACHPDNTTCATSGDCCSQQCNGVICVAAGTVCKHIGDTGCTVFDPSNPRTTDCCDGTCSSGTCKTIGQCALLGEACTGDGDCCNTTKCDTGTHLCVEPPPPPCTGDGGGCTVDDNCCNKKCDPVDHQCNPGGGCNLEGYACTKDTDCCSLSCPGAGIPGATCASTCRPSGTGTDSLCSDGSQCCSDICDATSHCAPVAGGGCKTLGERCSSTDPCCSTNCVAGTSGSTCEPAYSGCNATDDICNGPNDCCTGLCSVAAGSPTPGRCIAPTGSGCTEDGLPCAGASNCCTRKCVDLGSGVTVCQPAGGCRMTGDFCDSTQSCCGGTDPAQVSTTTFLPSPYGVYCDLTGKADTSPNWDPSSKDNHVCSSGQSCNPPGNICGGSDANHVPASQNCCNSNPTGSGKDVCKPDLNGIMRCFGGGSATCPTGYDATNPACCIPSDGICNQQSECCGYAPCSADDFGVLRCNGSSCLSIGTRCTTGGAACCSPATCTPIPEMGFSACATSAPPGGCSKNIGQACGGSNGTCCVGSCMSGVCNYACGTTGATCSQASQCCSNICTGGLCAAACVAQDEICSADSDCCSGLTCPLAPGSTKGTCTGSTCAATGASCTSALCCNATDSCISGTCQSTCAATGTSCATKACCNATDTCPSGSKICTAPPSCPQASQSCSMTNPCCSGTDPELRCHTTSGTSDFPLACTSGSTGCVCETCAAQGETCTATFGCCLASQSYCATSTLSSCGPLDTGCLCRDARL